MPATKQSKPVTVQNGVGSTASPGNCKGSGRPWESGGLCPECMATADTLLEAGFVARRADGSLSPRAPRHAQVLNKLKEPAKPHPTARGRSAPVAASYRPRERDADGQVPGKAPERSVGASKVSGGTPGNPPETQARKTEPAVSKAVTAPKGVPTPRRVIASDPLQKPFTATIESYLDWLQERMGVKFNAPQRELAGRAITLYGSFQVSPERKAARAKR